MQSFVRHRQDIQFALRQLRKSPGFTLTAILTLALGIGANTSIFSLMDQAFLRSLPVQHPEQLVKLHFSGSMSGHVSARDSDAHQYFPNPIFRDLAAHNQVFSGILATRSASSTITTGDQSEATHGELVSGSYFEVLGVRPALGRLLIPSDDVTKNGNPVIVLSYGYWQRHFALSPSVLNQTIRINNHPFTVIGVAQSGFRSAVVGDTPDFFAPITMQSVVMAGQDDVDKVNSYWLNVLARLKPGVTAARAEAAIQPLWYNLRVAQYESLHIDRPKLRESFLKTHLNLLDGSDGFSPLRSEIRTPLLILTGMVGLLLLMACVNVASLLSVRATGRLREISIRFALGATRWQILRQLLVEGAILGLAGGACGILLARETTAMLLHLEFASDTSAQIPFSASPDLRILAFNFAIALIASIIFSLIPAIQLLRPDLTPVLKQQTVTISGHGLRLRKYSVSLQVGFSLLLLVGAALFTRTLYNLKSMDFGFSTDHLLTFSIDPRTAGYKPEEVAPLYTRLLETLSSQPGIRSVAASTIAVLGGNSRGSNITVAGYKPTGDADGDLDIERPLISADYFSSINLPIVAGRPITAQDTATSQHVGVVNQTFARHYFGSDQNAIGHSFGWGGGPNTKTNIEIVGVAKDAKFSSIRDEIPYVAYTPYLQDNDPGDMTIYLHTSQPPASAGDTVRRILGNLNQNIAIRDMLTMEQQIDESLNTERLVATLALAFGVLATVLSAVGLYGVLAYSTAQRTREIGIRMALGASRATVLNLILREVLLLAGIGVVVTIPIALLLTHLIRSQLFGLASYDPITYVAVTLLLAAVSALAGYIPARRAAHIEPTRALRYE